jgi:predicted NAD/FAD-dependent oxidoreductase
MNTHARQTHPGGAPSLAVIGAGVAGLAAARRVADAGATVTVFDKGRGPGGRCSVRRADGWSFDHGAQYLTTRDPRLGGRVREWLDAGVIARWAPRIIEIDGEGRRLSRSHTQRFVGVPGMNRPLAQLARGLDVRTGTRVTRLTHDRGRWRVALHESELAGPFDAVLVTTPPAQAVPLLEAAPGLAKRCARAELEPCWALMLGFEEPLEAELDAAFVNVGPLGWIVRDSSKPGRPEREAWLLHATPEWSREHLEADAADVVAMLRPAFRDVVAEDVPEPRFVAAHRWRYARPVRLADPVCESEHERGAFIAGDWCRGASVESAYVSGLEAAERIEERLGLVRAKR